MKAGVLLPHSPGLSWPRGHGSASAPRGPERARLLHYERLMGMAHLAMIPIALAAAFVQVDAERPSVPGSAAIVALALAFAAVWHLWLPRRWLSHAKVVAGLCFDVALCTLVVHLTGDHLSLLVFLYYLVVIAAALTLASRSLYTICAVVTAAYCVLLPVDPLMRITPAHVGHVVVFVASVWLVGLVAESGAAQIQAAERDLLVSLRAQAATAEENAKLSRGLAVQLAQTRALAASLDSEREQTRRLADMVIRAQEEERRRVSRELHDEANQTLAAVLTAADLAERQATLTGDAELGATLARLRRLAAASLNDLQRLAAELRPPALDEFGLIPALTRHVSDRTRGTDLVAEVRCEGRRRRLDPAVEVALYRIAQEAFANVQKHARARTARILLRCGGQQVRLDVTDDGSGFDPATLSANGEPEGVAAGRAHLGVAGMRERAAIVGGSLSVDSTVGGGTRVSAVVPISPAASSEGAV